MNTVLNSQPTQMSNYQTHYNTNGHFPQMYNAQPQRSSFAIQEILGLANVSSCRQNPSPDILDTLGMTSSMHISTTLSSGNINGNINLDHHQQTQNFYREQIPQTSNSSFCPWRIDTLNHQNQPNPPQPPPPPPPPMSTCHALPPRYSESVFYGSKVSTVEEDL
ncbi:hypothetical protein KUTeg_014154 [Tegillarca granosa]|uniref:Uncharacterized protein n=1 Tax=Tegillarca granosa TaxID=220873 RepID=A0ABQ9EZK2_TEGGR|nr:hypothetical protein KUTeg_014154 [Tegillarca granosa]